MDPYAIRISNLSKRYLLGTEKSDSLYYTLANLFRRKKQSNHRAFYALNDVSLDIRKGEVLGVIGPNGAGKSTLLKLISGITYPTAGRIEYQGRLLSLLEVGTGFHPDLTGKDNIYLNGALLGMRKAEIKSSFDQIVDFSGVEDFINTPVKYYSSGMYVRLAFAVAAHLRGEILIIDEILAVGDLEFQKKCLGRIEEVGKSGRTILFVSHNISAIRHLCTQCVVIDKGQKVFQGGVQESIAHYLDTQLNISGSKLADRTDRSGNQQIRCTDISVYNRADQACQIVEAGASVTIRLQYQSQQPTVRNVIVRLEFRDQYGQYAFVCNNRLSQGIFKNIPTKGTLSCTLPKLPLNKGLYYIDLILRVDGEDSDVVSNAYSLQVTDGYFYQTGLLPIANRGLLVDHQWRIE
ncbi:MAG: ABC transporter ATP-binding protein [Bacteroidota bacterium]